MTTDSLTQIAQWITHQPELITPLIFPAASNPFTNLNVEDIGEYQGSSRLGFIYQELCRRLFESHSDYSVIAEEVQIREGKETLGAIDFLLQHDDAQQGICQTEHWEVALKFYLLKDGIWYGPDPRDRLDIKLTRMLNHQLKMSKTETFKRMFPEVTDVIPKMLIQGRLYTNPFNMEIPPEQCLNYPLNHKVTTGFWCYQSQIELIGEPLYRLEKTDWLPGNPTVWEPLSILPDYSVHCQGKSGRFWMVVPEGWPGV